MHRSDGIADLCLADIHFRMDWRAARFDWNRARAFLVAAEEGSYSAAAKALGTTQPTIGRQVAALEEELGVPLFARAGHRLLVTPAGVELLEHARVMGEAAVGLSLAATGQAQAIDGAVCIAASELITAYVLPPVVARIRALHPGVEIELVASNTAQDLRRREADIAVRNFRPEQPELTARRVATRGARLYASRSYLERLGHPRTPAALAGATFLAFDRTDALARALRGMGLEVGPSSFPIVSESHLVQWQLARQGLGICVVMEEIGDADPGMVRVLPDLPPLPVPVWLVAHREVQTSRRMRVVYDLLAEGLARSAPG